MSNYTTEVRFICEQAAGLSASKGGKDVENIIRAAIPYVFDFDFPIFDEAYRNVLETKILKHYYTREIGEESVGLWKFRLNTMLNEIMPYYNKLYRSELLDFNPFYDVDYTREGNRDTNETGTLSGRDVTQETDAMTGTVTDAGTSSNEKTMTGTVEDEGATSDSNRMTGTIGDAGTKNTTNSGTDRETNSVANKNDHWDYYSDTPQGTIGAVPGGGQQAIEGHTYLTNVRHVTDDGTGSTSEKNTIHGHTIAETNSNTRTYNTTETGSGTSENTKTYDTVETDDGTTGNTRTYNTLDTRNGTATKTNNTTLENLQEYAEHVHGKSSSTSYSKLLDEFRKTFLNIDMMIIRDLQPLFFGLWE